LTNCTPRRAEQASAPHDPILSFGERDETDRKANQSAVPSQVMKLLIISAQHVAAAIARVANWPCSPPAENSQLTRRSDCIPCLGENQN
jgi:hypothetical protein